ncbi:MAG: hypothetical protein MR671_00850, partial [Clostridiales bacterium]|nr:hypothetical protein [Clostridiales bacterium]
MKKKVVMLLVSAMVIGLAGCGASESGSGKTATSGTVSSGTAASGAAASASSVSVTSGTASSSTASSAPAAVSSAAEAPAASSTASSTASSAPAAASSAAEAPAAVSGAETVSGAESAESGAEAVFPAEPMTYAQYQAAAVNDPVTVETYVQAKQSWYEDKASVYAQSRDGAYFLYDMACSEDDYDKLTVGQKIRVSGYKAEWSGEVEIQDATFEIEDGSYVAPVTDVTDQLGKDSLQDYMNQYVSFKGMTIEASKDADGKEVPFLYNYDGSGTEGDDLYFNASRDGKTYTFTIESYLTDKDSDVYKAVKNLKIGDTVDMEGFLYWYEGANPHITSIKAASSDSSAAETVESAASSAAS